MSVWSCNALRLCLPRDIVIPYPVMTYIKRLVSNYHFHANTVTMILRTWILVTAFENPGKRTLKCFNFSSSVKKDTFILLSLSLVSLN